MQNKNIYAENYCLLLIGLPLLVFGIIIPIFLFPNASIEINNNHYIYGPTNQTWTEYTGKMIVSLNVLFAFRCYVGIALLIMNVYFVNVEHVNWQLNLMCSLGLFQLIAFVVSTVLSVVVFLDMCTHQRCFTGYTPLYYFTLIEFFIGSAVFIVLVMILIGIFFNCLYECFGEICQECKRNKEQDKRGGSEPVEVIRNRPINATHTLDFRVKFHSQTDSKQEVRFHYQTDPKQDLTKV